MQDAEIEGEGAY